MNRIRFFDGHCDTAFELWYRGEQLAENTCHIDLGKASAFRAYAQVFAFCSYAGCSVGAPCAVEEMLTLPLKKLRQEVGKNADRIAFAATAEEVTALNEKGEIAALLSVEGPEVIGCDSARLPFLKGEGFVMTTLTWNADNALAGCHASSQGLSRRGAEFVRTAENLGILIDVSHLSERAFWDLVRVARRPILASHSNCRVLCEHTRNLTDDQLRAVAESGGTVGLNLYPPFLGENADFSVLQQHLEHMLRLCGEDHVAIGGDLDGCETLADGFSNLSDFAGFYEFLRGQGYEEALLDRIFYTNLLHLI
ncbi:MAG: dipeptidase [Faecousia sp.]